MKDVSRLWLSCAISGWKRRESKVVAKIRVLQLRSIKLVSFRKVNNTYVCADSNWSPIALVNHVTLILMIQTDQQKAYKEESKFHIFKFSRSWLWLHALPHSSRSASWDWHREIACQQSRDGRNNNNKTCKRVRHQSILRGSTTELHNSEQERPVAHARDLPTSLAQSPIPLNRLWVLPQEVERMEVLRLVHYTRWSDWWGLVERCFNLNYIV